MRILVGHGGTEHHVYEVGDLVRLVRNEDGPVVTAHAGDWGRVTRVHASGALDIRFAGYSRPKEAELVRGLGIPAARVEPCDARGLPLKRGFSAVWGTRAGR